MKERLKSMENVDLKCRWCFERKGPAKPLQKESREREARASQISG